MLHLLPRDILRHVVDYLDGLSLVNLECACNEVRLLRTPRLTITATPKRMRRGMQYWLEKNADRVTKLVCLRTVARPPRCTRCFVVKYHGVPPSLLVELPLELVRLNIKLDKGLTNLQRDTALGRLTNLKHLTLNFDREHGPVRVVPPAGVETLGVNCASNLTVVSFPVRLQCLTLRSEDGLKAATAIPTSCKNARMKCNTPVVTLQRFFGNDVYEAMQSLDIDMPGMPSLMEVMSKMPFLRRVRCHANTIMLGDELVTSSCLEHIDFHARYCFAVGFVKDESVKRLRSVRTVVALDSDKDETFDFHEFFGLLNITSIDTQESE